ncbi:response regulator [Alphaproteobacteria bacterium]|jgi:CheY-like chemotaxis protein/DNA-binding XRE family transcriptional regulator|nr:response regulator [Alphaproteobacteria bacterium]
MAKNIISDPQPIDVFVGARIRERRQKLEWTLLDLAQKLNISHQQVQKYEQGATRVSAGTLFELSETLGVFINYFYEGYGDELGLPKQEVILSSRKSPLKIALVENDPSDEMLIREAISEAHRLSSVHVFHTGEQVLDFLKNKTGSNRLPRPDVIFMNLSLPHSDGLSILRKIKKDRTVQDIPIVVLSNSINKKDLVESYRNFASGYIKKSFDFKEFKTQVKDSINYWSTICLPNM